MILALTLMVKIASSSALEDQTYDFPIINNDNLFMEPWLDNRSFGWLSKSCDFSEICGYGSRESKWTRLSGSMDTVYPTLSALHMPDLPSIAFGSNVMEKATLYSDPLRCLKPGTGYLSLRLWLHGLTNFRLCLVNAAHASLERCGSKISSFNSSFHSVDIQEPIPIGFLGKNDINILQLNFEVLSGFIIVDDISYSGEECDHDGTYSANADDRISFSNVVVSKSENVRKEIEAVLSRNPHKFGSYLITSFLHEEEKSKMENKGHICKVVPCNFDCDWSEYDFKRGISAFGKSMEFIQNTRGVWQQRVVSVSFRSSEIGYATMSSPRFEPLNDSGMVLVFKIGRAVRDKKLWFCAYKTRGQDCTMIPIAKTASYFNDDWLKVKIPLEKNTEQFQIVISQTTRSNDPQLDQNMIRSINILGC